MIDFSNGNTNGGGAAKSPDSRVLAEIGERLESIECQVRAAAAIAHLLTLDLASMGGRTPPAKSVEHWRWAARCVSEVVDRIVVDFYPPASPDTGHTE